ncbi:transmembrane and coiled-coil domains-containing protein 7 [Schistosoma haematobium]|uniref:Transmembrane and coiled-coil domains-containing protein 7 n=1 Tax=Schistosoma haematobium TaxID=6185 RepID=A0A922IGU6_SCHHA|nr:transmembrane and coiled-coil domains-containing protein 7 [Schistosoma haematobium]KAH9578530.1 transmembrane and coiled-coil domains-containing protein 7 [Schistosoma haematobium]
MDPKLTEGDEEGPSFSENKTVNFNLPSLPINVTALSSTFPQSISAVQQLCSVKGTTSKKRRLLGEQDRISALMSLNEFEDDYKSEAHRISSKTRLSQLTYSRASSDSKLYPETVDSVLPLIKPVSIVITDCFLESEEDDIVDSGQLVKKRRKNNVVLDEEKNVSRDNSEMLKLPVSSLQALSPIPYRCEDDVAIPDVVASDGAKHASSDGMVILKLPVSSLQALSPIPYRYEDDVAIPDGMCFFFSRCGCLFIDV